MKGKSFILISSCVIYLLFAFSCKQNVKNKGDILSFDTLQVSKVYHQKDDPAQPACNLQITFLYPESGTDEKILKTLQSLFIEKTLENSHSILTPQKALDAFASQYINEFNNFIKEDEADNRQNTENLGSELQEENEYLYYLILENQITYNKNNLLSFLVKKQVYEGGAHGSSSIHGYVINLETGNLINEDYFAGVNYSKNLSNLMTQKLARENGLSKPQDLENIGYINIADIAPNNNFTFDEKGITYYFNEYEIGAYFLGITSIFVPYEELNVYVANDSPIYPVIDL